MRIHGASDMPHYENVPFEVPEGWCWCTLDDLAFYKKGPFGSSLTKSMFVPDSSSAYKVYEQKNAIQKDHTLGSYFIDEEKYKELSGFKVEPNDIIVSCAGTIGETYVMPNDIRTGIINQALMLIRLHLQDIQDFYLLYFDFILKAEAAKESKGTAIKNIPPFDVLKSFLIPIPPLAEQGRILEEVNKLMSFVDSIDVSSKGGFYKFNVTIKKLKMGLEKDFSSLLDFFRHLAVYHYCSPLDFATAHRPTERYRKPLAFFS